jgi:hypothetical protein
VPDAPVALRELKFDEALERAPRACAPGNLDLKALRAAAADPERALHRR